MSAIKAFVKRYPCLIYFILTFAITWGGLILASGGPGGFPKSKEQFQNMFPVFIPLVLAGPSVAGIAMIALVDGKAGLGELLSRLSRWRVGIGWYAVALLTAPLVLFSVLLVLSLFSPVYLPGISVSSEKVPLLLSGIAAGLLVGFLEELGWTGFATPRLRKQYSVITTGLIIGVIWGAWHIFLNVIWISGAYSGGLSPAVFIVVGALGDLLGQLPAYRVLMVWVHDHTRSLLVAMLMHASLTTTTIIVEPKGISGATLHVYSLVSAAAMWLIVAAVVAATRGELEMRRAGQMG